MKLKSWKKTFQENKTNIVLCSESQMIESIIQRDGAHWAYKINSRNI